MGIVSVYGRVHAASKQLRKMESKAATKKLVGAYQWI